MQTIGAGEFKARCLALLDQVSRGCGSLLITKRGRPVACVVPPPGPEGPGIPGLAGSVLHEEDLVAPLDEDWEADR